MASYRFVLDAPGAQRVCVAGDFNGWDPESRRMKRMRSGEDLFVARVDLSPGTHEFKFVIDGEWACCPSSPRVINGLGEENSVVEVCE